jgi:hypothetical protein
MAYSVNSETFVKSISDFEKINSGLACNRMSDSFLQGLNKFFPQGIFFLGKLMLVSWSKNSPLLIDPKGCYCIHTSRLLSPILIPLSQLRTRTPTPTIIMYCVLLNFYSLSKASFLLSPRFHKVIQ